MENKRFAVYDGRSPAGCSRTVSPGPVRSPGGGGGVRWTCRIFSDKKLDFILPNIY